MSALIASRGRRILFTLFVFLVAVGVAVWLTWRLAPEGQSLSEGQLMARVLALPLMLAVAVFAFLSGGPNRADAAPAVQSEGASAAYEPAKPFMAQVVGVQWLNPLQLKDYSTEWNLLWTLGLVKPNKDDYLANKNPQKYSKVNVVADIVYSSDGEETFEGMFERYVNTAFVRYGDIYATNPNYFYTIAPDDKRKWREPAGVRVEFALPANRPELLKVDQSFKTSVPNWNAALKGLPEAQRVPTYAILSAFDIGNTNMPSVWTKSAPPDVNVAFGGTNIGFTSLAAALDYLKTHPQESVWAMSWDMPSYPTKEPQLNENLTLLFLAGPEFKTGRDPLAWIGYPASAQVKDFKAEKGLPPRTAQAWKAAIESAAKNAGKTDSEIGYVIHDAGTGNASGDRIGPLAQTLTTEVPDFDFLKQSFNTSGLLGDMGAGTALTNVALGIAYANHIGKTVLVAGTNDLERPTAVVVAPPAKVRPIDPDKPWFRARGEATAHLTWWGLRHGLQPAVQGYSD